MSFEWLTIFESWDFHFFVVGMLDLEHVRMSLFWGIPLTLLVVTVVDDHWHLFPESEVVDFLS